MKQFSLANTVGMGLRASHYSYIEMHQPHVPFFEVLADNFLGTDQPSLFHLEKIAAHYPITLHCVNMSLGGTDPLDFTYLKKIKTLAQQFQPLFISDHLAWTSFSKKHFHELLPLPFTEEVVQHIAERICIVQDFLGTQIMIENPSTYLAFKHSTMHEWDFLQAVADSADSLILLDVNNIFVSAHNTGFDIDVYVENLSTERIAQYHLAGFEKINQYLLDSHGAAVHAPVWELFEKVLNRFGAKPTVIEWDHAVPDFLTVFNELQLAQSFLEKHDNTLRTAETIC